VIITRGETRKRIPQKKNLWILKQKPDEKTGLAMMLLSDLFDTKLRPRLAEALLWANPGPSADNQGYWTFKVMHGLSAQIIWYQMTGYRLSTKGDER
jgi:hypothetical protein